MFGKVMKYCLEFDISPEVGDDSDCYNEKRYDEIRYEIELFQF